jgi:hypothetical protein
VRPEFARIIEKAVPHQQVIFTVREIARSRLLDAVAIVPLGG